MTEEELQCHLVTGPCKDDIGSYKAVHKKLDGNTVEQFKWAKHGAILEIPDAIHHVVEAYQKGHGVEPNRVAAFEWQRKAAENSDDSFYFDLAMAYHDGNGTNVNISEFWRWMSAAASAGDGKEAMYQLVEAHRNSSFGPVSEASAFGWVEKMAQVGAPRAMIEVARAYKNRRGTEKDYEQYWTWAHKAVVAARDAIPSKNSVTTDKYDWAFEDYPDALSTLSDAYLSNKDDIQAKQAAKAAAISSVEGLERARAEGKQISGVTLPEIIRKHLLSYLKSDGKVDSKDKSDYFYWLQEVDKAIDQTGSDSDDQTQLPGELAKVIFDLAIAHKRGIGTKKSNAEYLRLILKAAKARHTEAMYLVAMNYHYEDDDLGFSTWITQAVAAGSNKAFIANTLKLNGLNGEYFTDTKKLLEELLLVINAIRKKEHAVPRNVGVAHYTDGKALESMLSFDSDTNNVLRLYNIAYVNDPTEGERLIDFRADLLGRQNPLDEFFKKNSNEPIALQGQDFLIFVGSFSLVADRLDLWRAYGRDGKGFSIITPVAAFSQESDQALMGGAWADEESDAVASPLYSVRYKNRDVKRTLLRLSKPLDKISAHMKKLNESEAIDAIRRIVITFMSELLYLYKDAEYETEREARMIVARLFNAPNIRRHPTGLYEKVYVESNSLLFEAPDSKIFIGPKVENRNEVRIDTLHRLAQLKWSHCKVQYSDVPYR